MTEGVGVENSIEKWIVWEKIPKSVKTVAKSWHKGEGFGQVFFSSCLHR